MLSTVSVSLFGSHVTRSTDAISNYEDVTGAHGTGFFVRAVGSVAVWLAVVVGVLQECKLRSLGGYVDSYAIVTQSRTIEELLDEDEEEDGQFL